jgi:nucleoside-diphosphate-sugar epimerase
MSGGGDANMRILITGNMGYLGPCVIDQLRSSHPHARLVGFDIGYFGHCVTNKDVLPECKVDLQYFADIRKFPYHILKNFDTIIHLAAISNDPIGNKFEEITLDINYHASTRLAKAAKEAGVKSFVFASSCSMYGAAEDSGRTENSPLNPLTAYAKSKVLTEEDLEHLAGEGFTVTSLRFSTACGWSERLRLDLVLNDFVAGAVAAKIITILSDGTPWRPLINVKDMARAIDWAISRDITHGGEFLAINVGSDEWNLQVKDLAEAVAKVIPGVDISINKNAQPDKRSYRVNFGLFRKLAPGHQPKFNLITSIRELKEGLEAMEFKDEDFRNSKYIRLNTLTQLQNKGLLNQNLEWVYKK